MSNMVVTADQIKESLPDKFRKSVNQDLVDQINTMLSDPDMYESYRDNLVSYTSVLQNGKFRLSDYVNAVKYVSCRLMNMTQIDAYKKTFPQKYQNFVARGVQPKDIASYVTAYNKSKLVNEIMAQTLVPFHVLNQDLRQKALNTAVELMMTASSEKVRADATNIVLTHTKPPETQKVELDLGIKDSGVIEEIRKATFDMAVQQQQMIKAGLLTAEDSAQVRTVGKVYTHEG
ncbi:hypothetical protein [Acinetobacter sp. A47]|uniref:hypothetical protein n=1 Tax=Acinetobacter sp. A47 TaxID=1561217 RepID=UPI000570AC52|nr:hypothetical protein [Acinetobacter sp. A47]